MSYRSTKAEVSIVKVKNIFQDLKKAIELIGGISKYVKRGDTVLIKPNLVAGAPSETGATTDVQVVDALIRLIQKCNPSKIVIGESAGELMDTCKAFQKLGYEELASKRKVELLDFDRGEFVPLKIKNPLYGGTLKITKAVKDFDVFISAPKLKNNFICGITVALKNSYGLIPDLYKRKIHKHSGLEEAIVDINSFRIPDLIVVDGIIALEGVGGGTDFSHPIKRDLIICSSDPVAIDAVAARCMKQNPNIQYLKWAQEQGLGTKDLDCITVKGLPIKDVAHPFLSPFEQVSRDIANVELIDLGACSRCRGCISGSMLRYTPRSFCEKITLVCGADRKVPQVKGHLVLVGDCLKDYRKMGIFLPGCPPKAMSIQKCLEELGVTCRGCSDIVKSAMKQGVINRQFLNEIKIVCEGRIVHQGKIEGEEERDVMILVGDCMEYYYELNRDRLAKTISLGVQREDIANRIVKFIPGCPPNLKSLQKAINELKLVLDKQ